MLRLIVLPNKVGSAALTFRLSSDESPLAFLQLVVLAVFACTEAFPDPYGGTDRVRDDGKGVETLSIAIEDQMKESKQTLTHRAEYTCFSLVLTVCIENVGAFSLQFPWFQSSSQCFPGNDDIESRERAI